MSDAPEHGLEGVRAAREVGPREVVEAAGGEDVEMKEGEAAKAAEVKEEPMETEDGAEAVPKENGENAEEGGEKADAETAGTFLK